MKKWVGVLIIILLLLVVGLGGFIVYDKVLSPEKSTIKDNESVDDTQTTEKDYDLGKAKELLEKFGFYKIISCNSFIYDKRYSDDYKALIALEKVDSSKVKTANCSDIFSDSDYVSEFSYYKGKSGVCLKDGTSNTIAYSDVNSIYKKMYGEDMPKKEASGLKVSELFYSFYDYIDSIDSFASTSCNGCGGTCGPNWNITDIYSAKEIGNKLYIDVKYNHGMPTLIGTKNVYQLSTSHIDKQIDVSSVEEFEQEVKANYMDYLDIYEVEFEKINDHYVFRNLSMKLS